MMGHQLKISQSSRFLHGSDTRTVYIKISIVCFVIIGVWLLFVLPIILYHVPQYEEVSSDGELFNGSTMIRTAVNACSQGFLLNQKTMLCSPVCGEWAEFSPGVVGAFKVTLAVLYIFHLIGTIVALALSCYNYKIMFKFPSVLLVYYLSMPIIDDVVFFVRLIGSDSLFCHSPDLFETIGQPTPFCIMTGVVNNFVFTLNGYLWLFHTIVTFWKVWFPFHARQFNHQGHTKFIHIAIIVAVVIIPVVPIGAIFGTGGYVITAFPPSLSICYARNIAAVIYAFFLPFCIIFPIGSTLIVLTIYKLSNMKKLSAADQNINVTAESKLLVFFIYFAATIGIDLIIIMVGIRISIQQQHGFTNYFSCEALGVNLDDPCVLEVSRLESRVLITLTNVFGAITPYVILIYIVPVKKIKDVFGTWKKRLTGTIINLGKKSSSTVSSS